jgi:hypothetical protein
VQHHCYTKRVASTTGGGARHQDPVGTNAERYKNNRAAGFNHQTARTEE